MNHLTLTLAPTLLKKPIT